MGIKTYNPYTPSRRNMTGSDFSEITKTTQTNELNVFDVLKYDTVVVTKAAVATIEEVYA